MSRSGVRIGERLDMRIALMVAVCTTLLVWAGCVFALVSLWILVGRSDEPPPELVRLVEERAREGEALGVGEGGGRSWLDTLGSKSQFRLFAGFRIDVPVEHAELLSSAEASSLCPSDLRYCATNDGRWHVRAPVGESSWLAMTFAAAKTKEELWPSLIVAALAALIPIGAVSGVSASVVAAVVTRSFRRRMRTVAKVVESWATHDLGRRISDLRSDELGAMCARLDRMAAALEDARARERARAAHDERMRLMRLLHDDVKQDIFAASVHLALLENGQVETEKVRVALEHARAGLERLMDDVEPSLGKPGSLAELVASVAGRWGRAGDVHLVPRGADVTLPGALATTAREALVNAFRHASAETIVVRWAKEEHAMWVEVQDDGAGRPPRRPTTRRGGLDAVRDLVESRGGVFTVTKLAKGTRVRALVPRHETE